MKKRPKDNDTPNNSMDVRAKQTVSTLLSTGLFILMLHVGGFAPRHLKRSLLHFISNI